MTEQNAAAVQASFGLTVPVGLTTVTLPNVDVASDSPSSLLRTLATKQGIPKQFQFEVYSRLLIAKAVHDPLTRPYCIAMHLMAIGIMSMFKLFNVSIHSFSNEYLFLVHTKPSTQMFQQIIPEQHDIIGEIVEVLEKGSLVPLIVRVSGFRCLMAFAQYQFRFVILHFIFSCSLFTMSLQH
jgi:hypothetical protein